MCEQNFTKIVQTVLEIGIKLKVKVSYNCINTDISTKKSSTSTW